MWECLVGTGGAPQYWCWEPRRPITDAWFWQRSRARAPSEIDFGGSPASRLGMGQCNGLARVAGPAQLPSRAGVVGSETIHRVACIAGPHSLTAFATDSPELVCSLSLAFIWRAAAETSPLGGPALDGVPKRRRRAAVPRRRCRETPLEPPQGV